MVKSYNDSPAWDYDDKNALFMISECAIRWEDLSVEVVNETHVPMGNSTIPIITMLATLQSFDVENWNKRIYGEDVVMPALDDDPMIQHDMRKGKLTETGWTGSQWCGEVSHPMDMDPRIQSVINSERTAIRILKYWKEGNLLRAYVRTLPNAHGIGIALSVLDGMPAGFSMRGFGKICPSTRRAIAPLRVITYDSVARPSHKEAYGYVFNESTGLHLPERYEGQGDSNYNIKDAILESTMYYQVSKEDFSILEDASAYVEERSENAKRIREMFACDTIVTKGLNETGTHTRMEIDTGDSKISINAPVEKALAYQYRGLLSRYNDNRR